MTVALLLSIGLVAGQQTPAATPQLDPKLIRVHVRADESGDAADLKARRESIKHLLAAIADKKKAGIVAVDDTDAFDNADVVVVVEARSFTVPKVVIGLSGGMGSPNGRPGPATQPVRIARLNVTFQIARGSDPTAIANKNRVNENESGWKSAAEDVVKQLEKWIADHREAIIEARRRK
jgi:hypothetical protein